jgi:hypothetical protein
MSDHPLSAVLPAIEIAAFQRLPDGSFSSIAPPPKWFGRLVADATFPFLGHILEEARQFWGGGTTGALAWGPCAEVDEAGREFHYKVTAVTAGGNQYLLFQLDPGSDQMRDVLQKVRERDLAAEREESDAHAIRAALQKEVRRIGEDIQALLRQLAGGNLTESQLEAWKALPPKVDELMSRADTLVRAASRGGVALRRDADR